MRYSVNTTDVQWTTVAPSVALRPLSAPHGTHWPNPAGGAHVLSPHVEHSAAPGPDDVPLGHG